MYSFIFFEERQTKQIFFANVIPAGVNSAFVGAADEYRFVWEWHLAKFSYTSSVMMFIRSIHDFFCLFMGFVEEKHKT